MTFPFVAPSGVINERSLIEIYLILIAPWISDNGVEVLGAMMAKTYVMSP